jgi:hypothetical protein
MDGQESSPYDGHTEQQRQQQQQQMSDDGNSPDPATGQKRKRIRASRACETCRARKVKCNEENPCSNCIRNSLSVNGVYVVRTTNTLSVSWRSSL